MMNEAPIFIIYIVSSIVFYLPARWTRYEWSGPRFTPAKYWTNITYNIFFVYQHMRFIKKNSIPFYGEQDSSILGIFSLIMIIAHACAHTVTWDIKSWRSRKAKY